MPLGKAERQWRYGAKQVAAAPLHPPAPPPAPVYHCQYYVSQAARLDKECKNLSNYGSHCHTKLGFYEKGK